MEISQQQQLPDESSLSMQPLTRDEADYWMNKTRTGGAYIPPARLARLQQQHEQSSDSALFSHDEAFQRQTWEALKKSLTGITNRVNTQNLAPILKELFRENLQRGRGLFVRSLMRAQAAAPAFSAVYALLAAVVNSRIPQIGELLLHRLVLQFRRALRRNDKTQCLACAFFMAHLVRERVAHEILALQLLMLLLEDPVTDDSVEIAVGFVRECGAFLAEWSPRPLNAVFERFRAILSHGTLDRRIQYMIEVLFEVRRQGFTPQHQLALNPNCDGSVLLDPEDQVTHHIALDATDLDPQEHLNVFAVDPQFEEHEREYTELAREILGSDHFDDDDLRDDGAEECASTEDNPSPSNTTDMTGSHLIALRKTIYLTIMSSVDFEECGHKLLKLPIAPSQLHELVNMVIECCSQERTFVKFYGLLGERFCLLSMIWRELFERAFAQVFASIHRLETPRIRNVARLFAHLFERDAISWGCFAGIRLNERETCAASRILLKLLLLDFHEHFSLRGLMEQVLQKHSDDLNGIYPVKSIGGVEDANAAEDLRFAINFWTAIGLAQCTMPLRARLEAMPRAAIGSVADVLSARDAPQLHHEEEDEEALVSDSE